MKKNLLMILCVFFVTGSFQGSASANGFSWAHEQYQASLTKLLKNINPIGTLPGTVVASPQKKSPNYFFHWVRDGALVMNVLMDLMSDEKDPASRAMYKSHLIDFANLTHQHQKNSGTLYLGEPKYEVNGMPYVGPWGRPQNDGPALRMIVLSKLHSYLLKHDYSNPMVEKLFSVQSKNSSIIKNDLIYVLENYKERGFDLWEEVKGDHFYTRLVQYHSLKMIQSLVIRSNDKALLKRVEDAQKNLHVMLYKHFDLGTGRINENLRRVEGIDYKSSRLDSASILAFNHVGDTAIDIDHPMVMKTALELETSFSKIYSLNQKGRFGLNVAPAIGRYPEDQYYGGNPWFINTLGMAEYYYRLAIQKQDKSFIEKADGFLQRVYIHRGNDFQLDEQMDRDSGYMKSASDLTWSHAAFITAFRARLEALKALGF